MFLKSVFFLLAVVFINHKSYALTCRSLLDPPRVEESAEFKSPKERPLRFMSYNVFNLYLHQGKYVWTENGQERVDLDHLPNQKPHVQTEGVANAILQARPDFLMLQEVEGRESLARFNEDYLGSEYKVFMPSTNDQRSIGIAFLIRKNLDVRVEVVNLLHQKWTNPNGVVEPVFSRSFPIFKLFDGDKMEPNLIVAGAHFKSQRDRAKDPESYLKRQEEMKTAVRALREMKVEHPGTPIIVMGDYNSSRGDNEAMPHFGDGLGLFDAHLSEEHFVDKGDLGHVTHTFHPKVDGVEQEAVMSVMDRAFIDESLKEDLVQSVIYRYRHIGSSVYKPIPKTIDERNENPSDHYPIYFDLKPSVMFD